MRIGGTITAWLITELAHGMRFPSYLLPPGHAQLRSRALAANQHATEHEHVFAACAGLYYWFCVRQQPKRSTTPTGTFAYMGFAAPVGTGWSSRWEDGPPKPFMPLPVRREASYHLVPCWRHLPGTSSQPPLFHRYQRPCAGCGGHYCPLEVLRKLVRPLGPCFNLRVLQVRRR